MCRNFNLQSSWAYLLSQLINSHITWSTYQDLKLNETSKIMSMHHISKCHISIASHMKSITCPCPCLAMWYTIAADVTVFPVPGGPCIKLIGFWRTLFTAKTCIGRKLKMNINHISQVSKYICEENAPQAYCRYNNDMHKFDTKIIFNKLIHESFKRLCNLMRHQVKDKHTWDAFSSGKPGAPKRRGSVLRTIWSSTSWPKRWWYMYLYRERY